MRHLRDDYNRIQDPTGKIGEDEPVFLVRARDPAFQVVLLSYIYYQRSIGNTAMADFIQNQLPAIEEWQATHPSKQADLPDDVKSGLD